MEKGNSIDESQEWEHLAEETKTYGNQQEKDTQESIEQLKKEIQELKKLHVTQPKVIYANQAISSNAKARDEDLLLLTIGYFAIFFSLFFYPVILAFVGFCFSVCNLSSSRAIIKIHGAFQFILSLAAGITGVFLDKIGQALFQHFSL